MHTLKIMLSFLCIGLCGYIFAVEDIQTFGQFQPFELVYEPSGVEQLLDGRFIVIEDESSQPMNVFSLLPDGQVSESPLFRSSIFDWIMPNRELSTLEDTEGVALDNQGRIYAITSHSRKKNGKRSDAREQLVRFGLVDEQITDFQVVHGLRKIIFKKYKILKESDRNRDDRNDGGLNIEGLSFDKTKQHLLIGLRSPLVASDAIIVVMENPQAAFDQEEPRFSNRLIKLDLNGGGIRALSYDPHLAGFLIVSRKPGKSSRLWLWNGDAATQPKRIRIRDIKNLRQTEGVTPVKHNGHPEGILLVSDDGASPNSIPGHYLYLRYDQLATD